MRPRGLLCGPGDLGIQSFNLILLPSHVGAQCGVAEKVGALGRDLGEVPD